MLAVAPPESALLRAGGPIAPLVKWPGGKRRELGHLLPAWPSTATRYLEPFVGGGAALFATSSEVPAEVNDASDDLVALYRAVQATSSGVFGHLERFATWWESLGQLDALVAELAEIHTLTLPPDNAVAVLARHRAALVASVPAHPSCGPCVLPEGFLAEADRGVPRKLARMRTVQDQRGATLPHQDVLANLEGALRAAAYTAIRTRHNELRRAGDDGPERVAGFAVLRELAYAAMFRFNAAGDFNVPYGGISYNNRDLSARLDSWQESHLLGRLATTTLHVGDFEGFLEATAPNSTDFVFLDPPYLSDFRDYDGNGFGPSDHLRLAACLRALPCPFQLVIKATAEVRTWYADPSWSLAEVDKTYAWTIKGRNDRRATHLVIQGA
ncbi:MAG: DNA adenine methylase [Glaciecola sp.]|jgi:DNA adenine methylase